VLGLVVARADVEQLVDELASDHAGKQLVDDRPLVVSSSSSFAGSSKQRLVDFEGRQVEHPPVATGFTERCVDSLGRQAVVTGGSCRHCPSPR
jgi:hypothetical protein